MGLLIIISIIACLSAIVYGLSFDLSVSETENEDNSNSELYNTDCWDTSLQLRLENALSVQLLESAEDEQDELNSSSYGGSDAMSWLLSLFQSVMLSLFLWQPLAIYVITWIKIWMFTWNLEVQGFSMVVNVPKLCRRCCCGHTELVSDPSPKTSMVPRSKTFAFGGHGQHTRVVSGSIDTVDIEIIEDSAETAGATESTGQVREISNYATTIGHHRRPTDRLSYLCDDRYVVDDTVKCRTEGVEMGDLRIKSAPMSPRTKDKKATHLQNEDKEASVLVDASTKWEKAVASSIL